MITEGRFFIVLRVPTFMAESHIAAGDLSSLINSQTLQKKFNSTLQNYITNWGGTSIDVGSYKVLDVPLGQLNQVINFQNALNPAIPIGIGSTIDGAHKALAVAIQENKPLSLYVPGKTEDILAGKINKAEESFEPDVQAPPYEENIEQALNAHIQAMAKEVDPEQFAGLVEDFQMILQNFKINMPAFETMQVTNPAAYSSILEVVGAASNLAQMLLESGILNTDAAMMIQHQHEQEEQQAAEGEEGGDDTGNDVGGSPDDNEAKASKNVPVGTVKKFGSGWRIKTKDDGWKYVNRGLGQGEGGEAVAGTSAGVQGAPTGGSEHGK